MDQSYISVVFNSTSFHSSSETAADGNGDFVGVPSFPRKGLATLSKIFKSPNPPGLEKEGDLDVVVVVVDVVVNGVAGSPR